MSRKSKDYVFPVDYANFITVNFDTVILIFFLQFFLPIG